MPDQFKALAIFNAEVGRGLVHTDEWRTRMTALQDEFNKWIRIENEFLGYWEVAP